MFGDEPKYLTPGNSVVTLGTPLGPIGLLVCADIYGDPALLSQLRYGKKARVVAFTSYWTTPGAVNWQVNYAKKYGVYLIAANTVASPGQGGGVYGPQGQVLVQAIRERPASWWPRSPSSRSPWRQRGYPSTRLSRSGFRCARTL